MKHDPTLASLSDFERDTIANNLEEHPLTLAFDQPCHPSPPTASPSLSTTEHAIPPPA